MLLQSVKQKKMERKRRKQIIKLAITWETGNVARHEAT